MIQVFHTSWPELWLNPRVGPPPALRYSVVAQMGTRRVTPTAGRSGADLEPTSGFDLLNRLLAGKLLAVGGSIRVDIRRPVINDLRHLGPLLRVGSHRIPLIAHISPTPPAQDDRRDRGRAGPYVICQLTNGPRWVGPPRTAPLRMVHTPRTRWSWDTCETRCQLASGCSGSSTGSSAWARASSVRL